jgi:tRNA pseudouridine55 synthase
MARRKTGNPVHGWVILDKPLEMTSTRAVGAVRRIFQAQKAGHAGTLDPLATGILPIALGEATKTVPFAVEGQKAYRFSVRWGVETTTDDAEGQPTQRSSERPKRDEIERALAAFVGEIMQVPPQFSAIRVDGARAYDLARDGEAVELAARPITIDSLTLTDTPDADTAVFEAQCGKGAYVRALARDLGRMLGCFGHVVSLRRTRVGCFTEADAVGLDELQSAADAGTVSTFLKPVESALAELPEVSVSPSDAASLARGQAVLVRGRDAPIESGPAYAISKGHLIAIAEFHKGMLRPTRVFNYQAGG